MKRTMIAASLLWLAAFLNGCTKKADQSTAAAAQQAASGTSVAGAQNSAGTSIEPTNATAQNPTSENSTATPTPSLSAADSQSDAQVDFNVAGIRLGMTRQETAQVVHDVGFDSPTCAKLSSGSVDCIADVWDEQSRVAKVEYTLDADRVSDVVYSFDRKLLAKMKGRLIANYGKPSGTDDFVPPFTVWRSGRAELKLGRDGAGYALLILKLHQP